MQFLKVHGIFLLIFCTCAILRLLPLFDYQFTFDELSGLDRTQFNGFSEVIEKGVKIDAHPALIQLIIYYLSRSFGYITWIIKLPFILCSLGTVIYGYLLGRRFFSEQVGLIAASIFSFSLLFVFHAPIARMYTPGSFFSIALLYYFFAIFYGNDNRRWNYIWFGIFSWLCAVNHHMSSLFAVTVCTSGLFFMNAANRKYYLMTCALVIVFYLPHLPVTWYQLNVPGIGRDAGGWLEPPRPSELFKFVKVLFGTGKTLLFMGLLIVIAFILDLDLFKDRRRYFFLIIFMVNLLIVYLYSILRSPVFQNSVMMFAGTALVMFVATLLQFKMRFDFLLCMALICGLLIYKTYFKKEYFNQAVETVYEYQFARTAHYKNLYGDKEVYPLFFDCDTLMRKIYFKKYPAFDFLMSHDTIVSYGENRKYKWQKPDGSDTVVSSLRLFSEKIASLKCSYVIITSATPMYQAIIKDHFPYLLENTQTQAVNFQLYGRLKPSTGLIVKEDKISRYSSPDDPVSFKYANGGIPLAFTDLVEFPFTARAVYKDVIQKEGQVVLSRIVVSSRDSFSRSLENCISVTHEDTSYHYTARALNDFSKLNDSSHVIYSELFLGKNFLAVHDSSRLNNYIWNVGKENHVLRAFDIKIIDYWFQKWHYWD